MLRLYFKSKVTWSAGALACDATLHISTVKFGFISTAHETFLDRHLLHDLRPGESRVNPSSVL